MTKETAKELFCEAVSPVILGNSLAAHRQALSLYFKYGLSSVTCGARRNLWDLLNLAATYLHVSEEGRLALEQLTDFSDRRQDDTVLLLLPTTEADRHFINENRDALECRYLICDKCRIDELPIDLPERWV
ncbi:MAG: hypothetical protein IJ011_05040 [Clostridia bacterium]|nr:hypothetical protein [Clostridia bacterium]